MKKNVKVFRNRDILSLTVGVPGKSYKHIRAAFETSDGVIIFQEATIAALVRAYINIKTHPQRNILCFKGMELNERKQGYALWQLMEDNGLSLEEKNNILAEDFLN